MRKYGIPASALAILVALSSQLQAELRRAEPREFSYQFTLGIGAALGRSLIPGLDNGGVPGVELLLIGDVEYGRWFFESRKHNAYTNWGGSAIGYRLWEDEHTEFSIISTSYNDGFGYDEDTYLFSRADELEGINKREGDHVLGFRYQKQWRQNFLSLEYGQDLWTHQGGTFQAYYSYTDQRRNWDVNWNAGATVLSPRVMDYYYGVDEDETSAGRSVYTPIFGQRLHLSVTAQRPLGESWYLDTGFGVNLHSASFTNSPITRDNPEYMARITFNYVF